MFNILINAYACAPNKGSEPGMAWNWIINLAKHCKLHVITEGEWRHDIEEALTKLPQGMNITFYYNPISDKIRTMCWNQGDWRFYYYYRKWQQSTFQLAKEIIANQSIDIVHQLNMIGFREPGYLWKFDKPFIWGPTNAKENVPISYLKSTGIKAYLFIFLKNTLNTIQLKTSNRVKNAIRKASLVLAASTDSANAIKKYFDCDPLVVNESGLCSKDLFEPIDKDDEFFHVIWIGRFIFTKQLNLALEIIAKLKNKKIKLNIVGGKEHEELKYKKLAQQLHISDNCIWHGIISHYEVQNLMKVSHLFLFTSISEGTPHVVLEAISNNLPVLCFDTCGQGDSVTEKVGIKIPISTPEQSVIEFAEKLKYLDENRDILDRLSANCTQRQLELSWDEKSKKMIDIYQNILSSKT